MKVTVVRFPIQICKGLNTIHKEYFINIDAANNFIKEHNITEYEIYNSEIPIDESDMYYQD